MMVTSNNFVKDISTLVEDTCRSENNICGYGAWTYHIKSVIKYSKLLAEKLNADIEICELSAILHDYASVKDYNNLYKEHHIHSAQLAEEILTQLGYPNEKIQRIKHCIIAHRGSKDIPRETIEAEVIATADAMAHFDNVHSLLQLAYVTHKLDTGEGAQWVLNKLGRSWNKLMPEAKKMVKDKYNAAKVLLGELK